MSGIERCWMSKGGRKGENLFMAICWEDNAIYDLLLRRTIDYQQL